MKNGCLDCLLLVLFALCAGWATAADVWIDLETGRIYYTSGAIPNRVVTGDVDNDGGMEIVFGTSRSSGDPATCTILWSEGGHVDLVSSQSDYVDYSPLAIADLNNDGLNDLIFESCVFYYQGNHEFITDKNTNFSYSTKFSDINGDGILDYVSNKKWVNGSDKSEHVFSPHIYYFFIVDMNNDDKLDILCLGYDIHINDGDTILFWYENTGGDPLLSDIKILDEVYGIEDVFDYDYDGDEDLYVRRDGIVGFMKNEGGFTTAEFVPIFDTMPDDLTYQNQIIDIDTDGDWDLFGMNLDEKRFYVVEQLGYRSMEFEFMWISEVQSEIKDFWWDMFWWVHLYQDKGRTYFFYGRRSSGGTNIYYGRLIRVPVKIQPENSVPGMIWSLYQ